MFGSTITIKVEDKSLRLERQKSYLFDRVSTRKLIRFVTPIEFSYLRMKRLSICNQINHAAEGGQEEKLSRFLANRARFLPMNGDFGT